MERYYTRNSNSVAGLHIFRMAAALYFNDRSERNKLVGRIGTVIAAYKSVVRVHFSNSLIHVSGHFSFYYNK